uniref:ABC-type xenobiotic transporter n=1 Tax=Plectus sambesii TaxID=2011161 RepID=A0A914WE06_9BILA
MTVKKAADDSPKNSPKEEKAKPTNESSLFNLYRYASKCDWVLLAIGAICAVVSGCGMPFMAILFAQISQSFVRITQVLNAGTDVTSAPSNTTALPYTMEQFNEEIVKYSLIFVGIGILMFITASLQVITFLRVCENMIHRLRADFFKAVLRQNIGWFDENQSGTLTSKLFDNIERIQEGTGDKVAQLIQQTGQFICGLIVAFVYSWKLTLIMMSLTPVMVLSSAFIAKMMAKAAARESAKYMRAGAIAEEVLTSVRTVIAFNGQKFEAARYNDALLGSKRDSIMKSFYMGFGMFTSLLVTFGSYGLAFWIGIVWVHDGEMDPATVMAVFFSVLLGSIALGQAGPNFAVIGTAKGSAGAVYEIIDRVPEIDAYSEEGEILSQVKGNIEFHDVHFSYASRPDIKILNGVSFKAKAGETVALVGSSGCGKSTSVNLMLRYYDAVGGRVTLDGHDITKLNLRKLRKIIGVVSQEPILFNCTIADNVKLGKDGATDKEVVDACKMSNAHDFISKLPDGYKTMVGERGAQLSGGQKQRIAIARTLISNPKVLLLDEATSALDAESESIVQAALDKAGKGRTMLIVAHRLSTIRNADKIIALKSGNIEEMGSHAELMAKQGLYYDLVTAQQFTDAVDGSVAVTTERQISKASNRKIERHVFERQSTRSIRSRLSSFTSGDVPFSRVGSIALTNNVVEEMIAEEDDIEKDRMKAELKMEGAQESNFLQIIKRARPEWCMMAVAATFSIGQGAVFPLFSLLFTEILNTFAKTGDEQISDGRIWSIMFVVLGLVQGGTALGSLFFFGYSAEKFTNRLRSLTFNNILRQDVAYFDNPTHASGKICTRLASDAPNIKAAMDYRLGSLLQAVSGLIVSLIIAFIFSWKMALLAIGIFPFGLIGEVFRGRFENSAHRDSTKLLEEAGKVAMEAIENVRTVQALTLEFKFLEKFDNFLEKPHRSSLTRAVIQGPCYGLANSIYYFLYASSFLFGAYLVRIGDTQSMNVLRSLFAIGFSSETLGLGALYFPGYRKARTAAGLLFKMLNEEPVIDSYSEGGAKPTISGNITFNSVHFAYPQRPGIRVLKGLQLTVQKGKTLALVGPSGCGKSTVIGLLERFYNPLDGTVMVDGSELKSINPAHMRKNIALVSQEPVLFDCSIRENIIYGLTESVTEEKILEAARLANIHSFVSGLPEGYDTRVGEKGTQLSGGQKQRIAIARALVRDPHILLLDEATSALDTESEKIVQEALDRAREGRTCVVIAHRLSTIINSDVIAVVRNGVVVEQGSHQELMAQKGAYFALTEKQNGKS